MGSYYKLPVPPPLGRPVPDTRHAVSVNIPTWDAIKEVFVGSSSLQKKLETGYPRSFIHKDIKKLNQIVLEYFECPTNTACFLFPSLEFSEKCVEYVTSTAIHKDDALPRDCLWARSIQIEMKPDDTQHHSTIILHGVFCTEDRAKMLSLFWRLTGVGISSRLAEHCANHLLTLKETKQTSFPSQSRWSSPFHTKVCQRISDIMNHDEGLHEKRLVARDDVYLYQTGMSAICDAQSALLRWRAGPSVVFGFPYELTLTALDHFGPLVKFFPYGRDEDLVALEDYLHQQQVLGSAVQAIWCECPSNPLLRTADLSAIRKLADQYNAAVVVDDTVGTFANVNLLHVADVIVTSLTKSFSGYADVMGGSIVLNPRLPLYRELKTVLESSYVNCVYEADAQQLERNSRDFIARVAQTNETAAFLVERLHPSITNPNSVVTALFYPQICWSSHHYRGLMRPPSSEFSPGFGGLFAIEFEHVEFARIFFDTLNVHKGPSLGAPITLAQPYVQTVFHKKIAWAAECGLHDSIVRVSVGLEEKETLYAAFEAALAEADRAKLRKRVKDCNV